MSDRDVVTVRGLSKSYGGRVVVDGIDLSVPAGEIVGLIGANGAGKTTTVECIQGLRKPDSGTLSVLGLDPVTQAERLRPLIGSQLQDSALPDRLRVSEAVYLFGGRGGEAESLLAQFGLEQRRRSAFASLSGGERQRLFLVLALLNRPCLVILDELTQGLDAGARRNVWRAVDQLRREGTAVLLVTHELDEAEALCDRVVAMRAGRILDAGPPADLVDRYGRHATIHFTLSGGHAMEVSAEMFDGVPGVEAFDVHAGRVTIRGDRTCIAYVGARLVQTGWVPPDLSVQVPSLEDALLGLLEKDASEDAATRTAPSSDAVRSNGTTEPKDTTNLDAMGAKR
ncbi:MAG TPA: ABC transporter ATP-binding protein [Micromonosporaceae bacterium]